MRSLLIDNFDSYTYNLFQLVAAVNGVEPTVVTNDIDADDLRRLGPFDNVVISPGPGRPGRARDFGISAAVVARASVPVLGVCLGHQGIAAHEGAAVVAAPEPRHGFVSAVHHDGVGLLRGIPSPFRAVRYHSLTVAEPLPASLRAVARADDGVLMALAHRSRPLWGVQFHPESVATEYGKRLLENFRAATENRAQVRSWPVARPVARPDARPVARAQSRTWAGRRPPGDGDRRRYRLAVRTLPGAIDTEAAFRALYAGSPEAFWLDSAHRPPGLARFSFLGDGAGPLAESVTYGVGTGRVTVRSPGGGRTWTEAGTIFDYLERELARRVVDGPDLPFGFRCGYVGYFGYELKADLGGRAVHRSTHPDAAWLFADRMIAVDHDEDVTYLLALAADGTDDWLAATASRLAALPPPGDDPAGIPGPPLDPDAVARHLGRGRERYLADVEACRRELVAGESYEICLTDTARFPAAGGNGLAAYRALRRTNPAPYSAYLRLGGVEVASSSPERFLRIDSGRVVESKPIKGTAPRGRTPAEDERLRLALAASPKTRAENLMIVDLIRNDLGRVCEVGGVHVPQLMATETYATVHQLVSTVRGRLRPDRSVIDCVRACFPGGSMTGAPKLRTMEIIDRLETSARGVYSGALGSLGLDGTADLSIVIRAAVLAGGAWHVGGGGAVVLDSDPAEELAEMLLKTATTARALL